MRRFSLTLIILIILMLTGCVENSNEEAEQKPITESIVLDNLPARLEPIEESPSALPTLPPTHEFPQGKVMPEIVVSDDFLEVISSVTVEPKVIYTITPEKFSNSLDIWSGEDEENLRPHNDYKIRGDTLNIYSEETIIGFNGPPFYRYADINSKQDNTLCMLIKFKSSYPRVLEFVLNGERFERPLDYNSGMRFKLYESSAIEYCNFFAQAKNSIYLYFPLNVSSRKFLKLETTFAASMD